MSMRILATCALGALVGCAVQPDVSDPPATGDEDAETGHVQETSGAEALARVDENLDRLRALQVFEVGQLIVDMPEEAFNCYGPCPDWEPAIQAANEEAALRLDKLTAIAEGAVETPTGSYLCGLVDDNLEALRALAIVEVIGMIEAVPESSPQCYNMPCQEDILAADAENELREGKLDSIARKSSGM